MRRYLLGALPEPEQTALEAEYLNDDDRFEQMVAVESDLVDGYVRGRLNARERRQFEDHYLAHPDRRERAAFAQALRAKLDQHAERTAGERGSWLQRIRDFFQFGNMQLGMASAMAAALLALGIGAAYFLSRSGNHQQQVAMTETQAPPSPPVTPGPSVQPTAAAPSPAVPDKPRSVFASLVLVAGGLRGESETATPRLTLAPNVDYARLQVRIRRQGYPAYRASLRLAGGAEVWTEQRIKSTFRGGEEIITLTIPAGKLAAGDYLLTLRGVNADNEVDEVSKSLFRVERK